MTGQSSDDDCGREVLAPGTRKTQNLIREPPLFSLRWRALPFFALFWGAHVVEEGPVRSYPNVSLQLKVSREEKKS